MSAMNDKKKCRHVSADMNAFVILSLSYFFNEKKRGKITPKMQFPILFFHLASNCFVIFFFVKKKLFIFQIYSTEDENWAMKKLTKRVQRKCLFNFYYSFSLNKLRKFEFVVAELGTSLCLIRQWPISKANFLVFSPFNYSWQLCRKLKTYAVNVFE